MPKRILLAEASAATRQAIEALLRKQGHEVIAVGAADKAREVLQFSQPDLMVVDTELPDTDKTPFFDKLFSDPKASRIPLLLLDSTGQRDLPYPEEIIIRRPVDPEDFLHRVNIFLTSAPRAETASAGTESPLTNEGVDDDFLDAALGLDQIQVTESEIMDKTAVQRRQPKGGDKLVGFEAPANDDTDITGGTRVESLIITHEDSEIRPKDTGKPVKPAMSGTGKIEIVQDPLAIAQPGDLGAGAEDETHDYNWFINAMKDENMSPPPETSEKASGTGGLAIQDSSALVDPVTPAPSKSAGKGDKPQVEQFLDEFKKEMENLRVGEGVADSPAIETQSVAAEPSGEKQLTWQEKVEELTPEHIRLFTRTLAVELAERIAQKIVDKIDPDKLLNLIKQEALRRLTKDSK
ncbi:MAG: response regulator [Candidatus Zixiibacteriota bacterium]|nr:MAG: response regulator [candidate division Zixibacteria bacterium]